MSEDILTEMVAAYLRMRNVLFHVDFGSGTKLTISQAVRNKKLNDRAWPDVFIAEPKNGCHGLFLELKKEGTKITLRNGELTSNGHVREQNAVLEELRRRGYAAVFCVGFDNAVDTIDRYLKGRFPA